MKTLNAGFIGGGRITKILLKGFKNQNVDLANVGVFDTNSQTLNQLKAEFSEISICLSVGEVAKYQLVFIALHPPAIMEALQSIKNEIEPETIVISLAPKITIAKIGEVLKTNQIVRIIPNATSMINKGYNPVCFSQEIDDRKKEELMTLLRISGKTFEVEEPLLESYAITSAMLPTYFWFQWQEMVKIGEQTGISPDESSKAVKETLEASLSLMFGSGLSYDEVNDLIPVKPIGEHEEEIKSIFQQKLMGLFQKIKP